MSFRAKTKALLSLGIFFIIGMQWIAASATDTVKSKPLAYHEEMISALGKSDSVIPPQPPVHPVTAMYNREAVIPPQCYTRTEGQYNPCYVCHQNEVTGGENRMNDRDLQVDYSFSDAGMKNHWANLFEDRSQRTAAISDEEILDWINQDNYSELPARLQNAGFTGWIPDLKQLHLGKAAFDHQGFALDGSHWVAFNYKPVPSTFWPTNGSTDDVMIRLPEAYRTNAEGNYSRDVYLANLAILEAGIKDLPQVSVPTLDETAIGMDLDGDGTLGKISFITRTDGYVGGAEKHFYEAGLYPLGTEFLHTVRYVGIDRKKRIAVSPRMKEVRYMRKAYVLPKFALAHGYKEEHWEKEVGHLPQYIRRGDEGLDNEMGWVIQGFVEDRQGRLRANTYEENMFCMGCHTSIGSTIDKTFSFPRKMDGAAGWGYINLEGMPDAPNRGEMAGEIATYLHRVGGNEFRNNNELLERFFNSNGTVDPDRIASAKDVYDLITPSIARALELNKAYKTIVEDQDYIYGRDAISTPPENVYRRIDNNTTPTLPENRTYDWDIRLDWEQHSKLPD